MFEAKSTRLLALDGRRRSPIVRIRLQLSLARAAADVAEEGLPVSLDYILERSLVEPAQTHSINGGGMDRRRPLSVISIGAPEVRKLLQADRNALTV